MYAIAFDLSVNDTRSHHPSGVRKAYLEIEEALSTFGFRRIQGSLFVTDDENLSNLFRAIQNLKARAWFPASVRDIRAFRVELWSDFTDFVKEG